MKIRLTDEASGTEFVEVTLTLEQFTQAITSLQITAPAEVHGLEYVGKTKVTERRTIELPKQMQNSDRPEMSAWLAEAGKEDGWIVDLYLGSQGSIQYADGKTFLMYRVYRFVEQQEASASCGRLNTEEERADEPRS